jgi:hypothetical protein
MYPFGDHDIKLYHPQQIGVLVMISNAAEVSILHPYLQYRQEASKPIGFG